MRHAINKARVAAELTLPWKSSGSSRIKGASGRRSRRVIVLTSALVLVAIGAFAYGLAANARAGLESEVLTSSVQGADLIGSLGGRLPNLTPGRMRHGFSPAQIRATDRALANARSEGALTALHLINANGRIIYADEHSLIGTRPPIEPDIHTALIGQDVAAKQTGTVDPLDRAHGPTLDAYVPLLRGTKVYGVLELTQPLAPLTARINTTELRYYLAIGGGGLLVWLLLLPLVVRFARLAEKNFEPGRRRRLIELRVAIQQRQLEVHYQPIVETKTGCLRGAEALVRWRRGTELVPPADFLPLAESSGLIEPLTRFVLDRATAQAAVWLAEGRELPVSVNLSAWSLTEPSLAEDIHAALVRHALPPRLLVVEITETMVIEDEDHATASLDAIAKLGVQVSLDDFGTGYSSMTRVSRLPITELKVDRSFISNLTLERRPLVRAMIELAHTLGLRVVGEGVEDHQTLDVLRQMGCDLVQGYYYSRPLAAAEFDRWREVPSLDSEEVPELLAEANLDGYFTKLTCAWERCLGFSRDELMAQPYLDFVHPDDLESTSISAAALSNEPSEVVNFETRFRAQDGSWHPLVWCVRSDGRTLYGIAREIGSPPKLPSVTNGTATPLKPASNAALV
ncbi:MAG: hypothetical protein QOI10_2818 [Solirubrobacterales bacterium]|jgi:PAS domain S-box-containing protein|nr:hypothetical protein [Solirubrobacterales bacterium]